MSVSGVRRAQLKKVQGEAMSISTCSVVSMMFLF